jgi:predicted nucleic acid-binding protein
MKKVCKFIRPDMNSSFQKIYYTYEYIKEDFFSYHIYDNSKRIATYSKSYYDVLFISLAEDRKLKLQKIQNTQK